MHISLVKENYPIYLTDMLSAASVYTTGNELNYCLNTTVGLPQVRRHSIQLAEYKWPITQHDVITQQWEEEEEQPPLHTHTHTPPSVSLTFSPTQTHTAPPRSWIWKGEIETGMAGSRLCCCVLIHQNTDVPQVLRDILFKAMLSWQTAGQWTR